MRAEIDKFRAANEKLWAELEAAHRSSKRQAAPFRKKDEPEPEPKSLAAGRGDGMDLTRIGDSAAH